MGDLPKVLRLAPSLTLSIPLLLMRRPTHRGSTTEIAETCSDTKQHNPIFIYLFIYLLFVRVRVGGHQQQRFKFLNCFSWLKIFKNLLLFRPKCFTVSRIVSKRLFGNNSLAQRKNSGES